MLNTLISRRLRYFGSYLKLRKTCLADFVISLKLVKTAKQFLLILVKADDFDEAIKKS
jgi:hypothetical protein